MLLLEVPQQLCTRRSYPLFLAQNVGMNLQCLIDAPWGLLEQYFRTHPTLLQPTSPLPFYARVLHAHLRNPSRYSESSYCCWSTRTKRRVFLLSSLRYRRQSYALQKRQVLGLPCATEVPRRAPACLPRGAPFTPD